MTPTAADRERADAAASQLLESVEHALFEFSLSKVLAAHRLAARREAFAEVVNMMQKRERHLVEVGERRPEFHGIDIAIANELKDLIQQLGGAT
jgi:hypothetical protein